MYKSELNLTLLPKSVEAKRSEAKRSYLKCLGLGARSRPKVRPVCRGKNNVARLEAARASSGGKGALKCNRASISASSRAAAACNASSDGKGASSTRNKT